MARVRAGYARIFPSRLKFPESLQTRTQARAGRVWGNFVSVIVREPGSDRGRRAAGGGRRAAGGGRRAAKRRERV